MRHIVLSNAIAALAVGLITGCGSQQPAPQDSPISPETHEAGQDSEPVPLEDVTVIADNLDAPWSIAFADQTPVISQRDTARIVELDEAGEAREVAVVEQTEPAGEGGLLGIAIFQEHLYAYLTTSEDNRVHRYELTGDPGSLQLGDAEVILEGIPAAQNHNGGRLAFGPDDMLYITTGDAVEPSQSQDVDSLAGKILRLTPEGEVPADNPFDNSPVYSYGHRNPQGLDWTDDGTMYASEFGQDTWDELNVIQPGGNYGWPEVEGIGTNDEYINPVQQWTPAEASPSGIEISDDALFMVSLRGERLWEIPLDEPETSTAHFTNEFGRLRDVTTAPDGSLWVLTSNTDGNGEPSAQDDRILEITLP